MAITITGAAPDPMVSLIGQGAHRSQGLSNGCVYSIFNGLSTTVPQNCTRIFAEPQVIKDVIARLINEPLPNGPVQAAAFYAQGEHLFRVTHFSNQLDGRTGDALSATAESLAEHGLDASVLDVNRVLLASGPYAFQTVALTYTPSAVAAAQDQPLGSDADADAVQALLPADAPTSVIQAARKLALLGFDCTPVSLDSLKPTLIFRKGGDFDFIKAELSYIR